MKNSNIKSLEDLRKTAMNPREIDKHVSILIKEIEEKIILGLQKNCREVKVDMYYCDFHLVACDEKQGAKIILFNLLEILKKKNYRVGVIEKQTGYVILIDISRNVDEMKLLDEYINKFKI